MTIGIAFGRVLRKWRISRGLSQTNLADRANLDRTFISMLERGERQPTLSTIMTICKVLKVNASELVRQTELAMKRNSSRAPYRGSLRNL